MANSPTSQSASTSNAAKDDVVGANGKYIFSIKDLLANDPGSAGKLDLTKQFFFGDSAYDQAHQAEYLAAHHIVKISDANGGTYQIESGATDFNYFIQMGNKGTWSEAHVSVIAPEPPAPTGHLGGTLFAENFDSYQAHGPREPGGIIADSSTGTMVGIWADGNQRGWTGTADHIEFGVSGYGGLLDTSGAPPGMAFWLDTQNSPGGANLSHAFTDTTPAVGGITSVLSFDIAKQAVTFEGQNYATDPNASFDFKIDGKTVAHFTASDFAKAGEWQHFDINIGADIYSPGTDHVLQLVDTTPTPGYVGFAIDTIQIHDWVV